jgi:NAD(P)-dependent dehydrogenase (short-subunit alcohol dehydrogenase family)
MQLEGQVALITGAGSGLGRAMALGLANEGAKIFIAEVREEPAEQVRDEIKAIGGVADIFVGDVGDEATSRALIDQCVERLGGLDILINNAGLRMEYRDDGVFEEWRCLPRRPTQEVSVEDWDFLMRINLRAPFLCTHFALPHMIERKHGTIIGLTSDAGNSAAEGKSAYCASKHGIEGLMKTVAEEVRPFGISANSIHPGGRANVDGRGGVDPEVMVPPVVFLCAQKEPTVTGQTIMATAWNDAQGAG